MLCQSDVNLCKSQNLMLTTCSDEAHSRRVSPSFFIYIIALLFFISFLFMHFWYYFYLFVFIFVSIVVMSRHHILFLKITEFI